LQWSASTAGIATASYAIYVIAAWWRYGHSSASATSAPDPLLDRFMPVYDVAERYHIRVSAPADITFAAACEHDLMSLSPVRAIFKARELLLGLGSATAPHPQGLLAFAESIGWSVLAVLPGREVVMGAVTQPWCANVVFRPLAPDEFTTFREPGYVKIVWTLRADPIGATQSIFHTETRAVATDADARSKFRWYWARFSPGIKLIRLLSLNPLRRDAERRAKNPSLPGRATQPVLPVPSAHPPQTHRGREDCRALRSDLR
jgi:hypothetical protein